MSTPIVPDSQVEEKAPLKGVMLDDEAVSKISEGNVLIEKEAKTEANALKEDEPDKPEEEKEEPKDEKEVDEPEEEVIELDDPGEFKPQDYSFEVIVYDDEGKKPKTIKIDSISKWEEILADDPNLGNSLAVNKAFRAAQKMESSLEADEKSWKQAKDEYEKVAAQEAQSEQTTQTWANEIAYLEDRGDLPKVPSKFKNVSWIGPNADKDALENDAVKAQISLLNYMKKENTKRRKLGLSNLGPEGAFNTRQRDTQDKKEATDKKQAGEARKEAGARIASSSPNPVTVAPKGIAVGVGGSLRDLSNQGWQ